MTGIDSIAPRFIEELQDILLVYVKWSTAPAARIQQGLNLVGRLEEYASNNFEPEARVAFWKRSVSMIGKLCQEHKRDLRIRAYTVLQGIILGEQTLDSWEVWKDTFERILFGLVVEPFVITKEMLQGVTHEMRDYLRNEFEMSRERAVSLLCQCSLIRLNILMACPDFPVFWIRLIRLIV